MDRKHKAFLAIFSITTAIVIIILIPTLMYIQNKETDALEAIEERHVKEGTQYTAIVEAYDVSNQLLIMDNGHEIDASELSRQPDINDKLSYIKTFDYEISKWTQMPKETGETAFINIKIIN